MKMKLAARCSGARRLKPSGNGYENAGSGDAETDAICVMKVLSYSKGGLSRSEKSSHRDQNIRQSAPPGLHQTH